MENNVCKRDLPESPASQSRAAGYRGRLAPSPSGLLHLGHARTFLTAFQRAHDAGGTLVLRNDDLDRERSRPQYVTAMLEDLDWIGIRWQEGPSAAPPHAECGAYGPYSQSARLPLYRGAVRQLLAAGQLYPCTCTRSELAGMAGAPHEFSSAAEPSAAHAAAHVGGDAEPMYPGTCRAAMSAQQIADALDSFDRADGRGLANWRFRTTDAEAVAFTDRNAAFGPQKFVAGQHFNDFVAWRRDGVPSYQLACVVDDAAMRITEVVRGADLLLSTARQILLQRALHLATPEYFHCELVLDGEGRRLAKRSASLSIRALRERGATPEELLLQPPP